MKYTILIDPGHGGQDSGAEGHFWSPDEEPVLVHEKDVNLNIGLYARRYLNDHYPDKFMVHMTRREDKFLTLQQRCDKSHEIDADLFLSVHCNSWTGKTVTGIETYYYYVDALPFARTVHFTMMETLNTHKDRGIKEARYYVIKNSVPEAVLIECEFLSNIQMAEWLNKENTQRQYGLFIGESVREYFLT